MILQSLANHYKTLLNDENSNIAKPGYSSVNTSHVLVIDKEGNLVDIVQLDKKTKLFLPERVNRTSGIRSNNLADTIGYVLGVEYDKKNKNLEAVDTSDKLQAFKEKNEILLENIFSPAGVALKFFLEKWSGLSYDERVEKLVSNSKELASASTIIFKLDGEGKYLHDDYNIVSKLINYDNEVAEQVSLQCLVTGESRSIARTHNLIKGIVGSKPSGGSLVGFNDDAYCSYGKKQSFNAPVSDRAVFEYTTAVGYLIDRPFNSVRIGNTTMLFWAEKQVAQEEKILAWSLEPIETEEDDKTKTVIDSTTRMIAKELLQKVSAGLPIVAEFSNTKCFFLGLSPNAARLSVRFWQVNSFGEIIGKIVTHYQDMEMVRSEKQTQFVRPLQVLVGAAVQGDYKNIIPLWSAQFLKAIITGQMYPQSLYQAILMRCRTSGDKGGISYSRASFVKAFLKRKYRITNNIKGDLITVSLNENNNNTAYLLGRLFSLLEKVQKDALGSNINSTIRDRYFGTASSTPRTVFPILFRLSRHHIAKAEYGMLMDRKIQGVVNKLGSFPARLSLEEQGEFILGYYHQNQANYEKKEGTE